MNKTELKRCLGDQEWRLNNLYTITDPDGHRIQFKMNWAQRALWESLWFWMLVLKCRQIGISTFIQLLMLDTCLFNPNTACAVIAHDKDSVIEMFRRNIKGPYESLPASLRAGLDATTDKANQLVFANGSSIRVATSVRSGTFQMLHVSEFGKICARYPERAREIVTGSFETVAAGNIVTVESTAEGREGYFYDYCQAAQALEQAGRPLSSADWRFFFFPWWKHPAYRSNETDGVIITAERKKYFEELEAKLGITLPLSRRVWYVRKAEKLGDDMLREHPSTPEEAFQQTIRGAYYADQITAARKDGRITRVPVVEGSPVETWWDLGVADATAIWFVQPVGRELRVIDYYENSGEGLQHYAEVLREKGYFYSRHIGPHDIRVRDFGTGVSRLEAAKKLGLVFEVAAPLPVIDGINGVRNEFTAFVFDAERCDDGLKKLERYRKEWNENLGCYRDHPLHDDTSHAADALRTGIVGRANMQRARAGNRDKPQAAGWT